MNQLVEKLLHLVSPAPHFHFLSPHIPKAFGPLVHRNQPRDSALRSPNSMTAGGGSGVGEMCSWHPTTFKAFF